jgi:hypothetical protein
MLSGSKVLDMIDSFRWRTRFPASESGPPTVGGSLQCDCAGYAQFIPYNEKFASHKFAAVRQAQQRASELFGKRFTQPDNLRHFSEGRCPSQAFRISTKCRFPGFDLQQESVMSTLMHKLLIGSAALALAQLAQAQSATVITATPAVPADAAAAPAPAQNGQALSSGAPAPQGAAAAGSGVPVMVVPAPNQTVASNPATDGSNDPLIQRRKEKAQAKAEYEARVKAAKSEYKQDKHDAKSAYRQDKREANAELRAANPVTPNDRVNYGHGDMNSATSGR